MMGGKICIGKQSRNMVFGSENLDCVNIDKFIDIWEMYKAIYE